jgi:hypothetical protein
MTTPVLPDVADLNTFGGTFVNADAVIDPTTDMDATFQNRLTAQAAMLSHTAPRAWCRCTVTAGVIARADHDAVWGSTSAVAPTVARSGTGVYTVTWASSYDDLQSTPEAHTTALRGASVTGYLASTAVIVNGYLSGSRVATVTSYNAAGVAADVDQFLVVVW